MHPSEQPRAVMALLKPTYSFGALPVYEFRRRMKDYMFGLQSV